MGSWQLSSTTWLVFVVSSSDGQFLFSFYTRPCKGEYGGDSHEVQGELVEVQRLYATNAAFAALRADARLVTWGGGELQETLAEVEEVPIRPGLQSFGLTRKDQTREGDPDGGCLGFVRIMPHASA